MGRPALAERTPYDREQVVDAAVRVFCERGYDGTSMSDIAAALGLHKSSLYHHIGGKEQLLAAALQRALGALSAMLEEPESVEGRAVDRLEHVVRRTVDIMVRQLPEVTVLLRVRGNTATERWALEQRRTFDRAVEAILARAAAEGELRDDLPAGLATRLVFGMSNSATEWFQASGQLTSEDLARAITAIVFDGLRRSPDGSPAAPSRRVTDPLRALDMTAREAQGKSVDNSLAEGAETCGPSGSCSGTIGLAAEGSGPQPARR